MNMKNLIISRIKFLQKAIEEASHDDVIGLEKQLENYIRLYGDQISYFDEEAAAATTAQDLTAQQFTTQNHNC